MAFLKLLILLGIVFPNFAFAFGSARVTPDFLRDHRADQEPHVRDDDPCEVSEDEVFARDKAKREWHRLDRFPRVSGHDPRMKPFFSSLGPMFLVASLRGKTLVWSSIAPEKLDRLHAISYCLALGGGARLPSVEDFLALMEAQAKSESFGGCPHHPGEIGSVLGQLTFWSSTAAPTGSVSNRRGYFFSDYLNNFLEGDDHHRRSVICVMNAEISIH
jgi:hypothetical protein